MAAIPMVPPVIIAFVCIVVINRSVKKSDPSAKEWSIEKAKHNLEHIVFNSWKKNH